MRSVFHDVCALDVVKESLYAQSGMLQSMVGTRWAVSWCPAVVNVSILVAHPFEKYEYAAEKEG